MSYHTQDSEISVLRIAYRSLMSSSWHTTLYNEAMKARVSWLEAALYSEMEYRQRFKDKKRINADFTSH